jgi:hypothetical protein
MGYRSLRLPHRYLVILHFQEHNHFKSGRMQAFVAHFTAARLQDIVLQLLHQWSVFSDIQNPRHLILTPSPTLPLKGRESFVHPVKGKECFVRAL